MAIGSYFTSKQWYLCTECKEKQEGFPRSAYSLICTACIQKKKQERTQTEEKKGPFIKSSPQERMRRNLLQPSGKDAQEFKQRYGWNAYD